MSTVKRTASQRSPETTSNKKLHIGITPEKPYKLLTPVMEQEETMNSTDFQARDEAFKKMAEVGAPVWFKEAFSLIWKDLSDIRQSIYVVKKCEAECEKNHSDILQLQSKISVLEEKNKELENQLTRLDLQERKNNVLVHGISEMGPNENIEATVAKFSKETLKITDTENLGFDKVYRMGKTTSSLSCPSKESEGYNGKIQKF